MAEPIELTFPKLADTLVEGTIVRWLKEQGESVKKGEPIVEVETDKVNTSIEAPVDGVRLEILATAGETIRVGQLIARIHRSRDVDDIDRAHNPSGPDVVASHPSGGLTPMRQRIAERVQEARATIPQGSCVRAVDLSHIDRAGVSWTALFVHALAAATSASSIGIAVDRPDGLVVPVIRDAARLSIGELSAAISDLVLRARQGQLRPQDVVGAQWTVTNVGTVGTLMAFPIVSPGQDGVLAIGTVDNASCYLTLGYDRRAIDDYSADRLLLEIASILTDGGPK